MDITPDGFRGEYFFLSNFYEHEFSLPRLGQDLVKSGEHAFNALKTQDMETRAAILSAPTPGVAKKLGRRAPLRPGWDTGVRVTAMMIVLQAKFNWAPQTKDLAELLVRTGDVVLVETNTWHDNFWGDCSCGRYGCYDTPGKNMLGELLMSRRSTLRQKIV